MSFKSKTYFSYSPVKKRFKLLQRICIKGPATENQTGNWRAESKALLMFLFPTLTPIASARMPGRTWPQGLLNLAAGIAEEGWLCRDRFWEMAYKAKGGVLG